MVRVNKPIYLCEYLLTFRIYAMLTVYVRQTFFHDGLPLDVPQSDCELLALPLWITMQHVGQEQLSNIVSRSHVLAKEMASRLQKNESIHLYSGEEVLCFLA